MMSKFSDVLPKALFSFGLIVVGAAYGIKAQQHDWFPVKQIRTIPEVMQRLDADDKTLFWFFQPSNFTDKIILADAARMMPGLTKLVSIDNDLKLLIQVIDKDGNAVHEWRFSWWDIWPQPPEELHAYEIPQAAPGTVIHGVRLLPDGDVVFNFEYLGLVRMNACGDVVWKRPIRSHHSVFRDDGGNFWVPILHERTEPRMDQPFIRVPYTEQGIMQVAPTGETIQVQWVDDLLIKNGLVGLLYESSTLNEQPVVTGDTQHLNDVEVFSQSLQPGFFHAGDVMISLRNSNAILVFDRDWQLKYHYRSEVVRQHDPDFLDGDRFSVFDNRNIKYLGSGGSSRIIEHSVVSGRTQTVLEGNPHIPFFTDVMGKQQRLDNGNLLVTESHHGRAIEVNPDGERVWEYVNLVDTGWTSVLTDAERLPLAMDAEFFHAARARCEHVEHE